MSKIPEIRIYCSFLLAGNESKVLAEKYDIKLHSGEQFKKWTENYQVEWKKYESKIVPKMQECVGLQFYKPIIDVACAPVFTPKSDPLIMSFYYYPDQFVDVLAHELCHVLLEDNNKVQVFSKNYKIHPMDAWEKLFGKYDNLSTLAHIPVQAMMKYIYLDVLKEPARLTRDVKDSENHGSAYTESWAYVEKHGYKEILSKLKESYAGIN